MHDKSCALDCVCLPPLERIGDEYWCRPSPEQKPKHVPVFGSNYLIHYFKSPHCLSESQKTIYNQLPKRVCGRLSASHEESALGWDLCFEEGWHWRSIYFVVVFLLLTGSLIFGVLWTIFKGDVQGAFAISSVWITSGSLLLGYVAVRSC